MLQPPAAEETVQSSGAEASSCGLFLGKVARISTLVPGNCFGELCVDVNDRPDTVDDSAASLSNNCSTTGARIKTPGNGRVCSSVQDLWRLESGSARNGRFMLAMKL